MHSEYIRRLHFCIWHEAIVVCLLIIPLAHNILVSSFSRTRTRTHIHWNSIWSDSHTETCFHRRFVVVERHSKHVACGCKTLLEVVCKFNVDLFIRGEAKKNHLFWLHRASTRTSARLLQKTKKEEENWKSLRHCVRSNLSRWWKNRIAFE